MSVPLIELHEVCHRYGQVTALDRVSLSIGAGERVGIAGVSGSGKSTLARALTLHLKPQSGEVRLSGLATGGFRKGFLWLSERRRFQLVFQDPGTSFEHHWKLWRVISEALAIQGLGEKAQRKAALDLLERVRLPLAYADRFPLELSGGERRRVAIARALAAKPNVLVLDESLSGLDEPVQRDLIETLERVRQESKMSLVTVSHDLRILREISDRLVVMERGRVAEDSLDGRLIGDVGRRIEAASFWRGPAEAL